MSEYDAVLRKQRDDVVKFAKQCADESRRNEKDPRRPQNTKNWDYFHGTIDWSHKKPEDPKIHLHKVGVAAERTRAKFKSALVNYDKWITVEREYVGPDSVLPDFVAKSLLIKQLERADAKTKLSDAILLGIMESRMTLKIGGKYVTKPRFVAKSGTVTKEPSVWQLDLNILNFEQYLRDTERCDDPLYEFEEFRTDYFRILDLASDEQSPDKPYRLEAVKNLGSFPEREQEWAQKHAAGNLVRQDWMRSRKPVLVWNCFATVLAEDGSVYEWETEDGTKVPLKNVFFCIANENELLIDPQTNKRWSARAPFITADPMRSPGEGRKALMDAGTDLNQALDELFTLMLTGAIKSAHNVTWYRDDWVSDKKVLSGGLKDGDSIAIDGSAPPNAVPFGVLKTGEVPQDAMAMQQILDRSFAENVISNQIDLSGNLPSKQIRATEAVQASTAISDVFDSMAADIEDVFIEYLAEECFMEVMQHLDELDADEVRACFGPFQDLADKFLKMTPRQRFKEVSGQFRFKGKGLKGLIANQAKAQALINLLNTITANPITFQAIETQVSAAKVVKKIAKGLGIDVEEIAPDAQESQAIQQKQMIREQALAMNEVMGGQNAQGGGKQNPSQATQPNPMQSGNGQGGM